MSTRIYSAVVFYAWWQLIVFTFVLWLLSSCETSKITSDHLYFMLCLGTSWPSVTAILKPYSPVLITYSCLQGVWVQIQVCYWLLCSFLSACLNTQKINISYLFPFLLLDNFFIYISNVITFPGFPSRNPLSHIPSFCEGAPPLSHPLPPNCPSIPLHWGFQPS